LVGEDGRQAVADFRPADAEHGAGAEATPSFLPAPQTVRKLSMSTIIDGIN
jgi:hypothetical protein